MCEHKPLHTAAIREDREEEPGCKTHKYMNATLFLSLFFFASINEVKVKPCCSSAGRPVGGATRRALTASETSLTANQTPPSCRKVFWGTPPTRRVTQVTINWDYKLELRRIKVLEARKLHVSCCNVSWVQTRVPPLVPGKEPTPQL